MRLLVDNKGITNRALAAELGLSDVSVATRIRRLVDDRIVIFTALLDWEAAGYEWFVIGRFTVGDADVLDVARALGTIASCTSSAVVRGSAQVQATFLVADRAALQRLKQAELAVIAGIERMSLDLALASYTTPRVRSSFLARQVRDVWLPAPRLELDRVDVGVIEALIADGRAPHRRVARELGVSDATVRARRTRLEQAGLLSVVAMLNPLAFGQVAALGQVGLRVRVDALTHVVSCLRRAPSVVQVALTVGAFDAMVAVSATDHARLIEAIEREVAALDGVVGVDVVEVEDVVHFVPFLKQTDGL